MQQQFSSTLLEKAVAEFSKLPGIGRKTALRLVLFMLKRKSEDVELFADTISRMRREVKYCRVCHNISDTDVCPICSDSRRDASTICVVENVQDVLAIENTQQFHGLYHVLGGIISPMDGIGPSDIEIESLVQRVAEGGVKEVILLSAVRWRVILPTSISPVNLLVILLNSLLSPVVSQWVMNWSIQMRLPSDGVF